MQFIELTNTFPCASLDEQRGEYVFYTGGIAGVTDATELERNPEAIEGGANKVELDRQ
jgi:hypothetical protein